MQINNSNINELNNNFKGFDMKVEKVPELNEIMRAFRTSVMPNSFKEEKTHEAVVKETKAGIYSLEINTYKSLKEKTYVSDLSINYTPNDKDFTIGKDLASATKQDILDFLGNEKNADKIEFLMSILKTEADRK